MPSRIAVLLSLCFLSGTQLAEAASPLLWLDASHSESITLKDGAVARWDGRQKGKQGVSQPKAEARPRPGSRLGKLPTISFDSNDFLEGEPVLEESDDTFTMIALWKPSRLGVQSVFEQAGSGRGRRAALLQVNGAYGFNGQSNDFHSAVKLEANAWRLSTIVVTGAKRDNVIVLDNDSPPVVGTIDIDIQNTGIDRIVVGKKIFGGEFFQGDLAELRVFGDALTQDVLKTQLTEIKTKWGLSFESHVPKITAANPASFEDFEPTAEQLEFFESKVRPLLVDNCYSCHSGKAENLQAGLRLDGRALAIKGGDSGSSIVPGNPAESLLIEAVTWQSYEMPPAGKLKDSEIATLTKWIEIGAPWPGDSATVVKGTGEEPYDWQKWRTEHWSFQPVVKPELPRANESDWPIADWDRFVLAKLEEAGLKPVAPADARTLVRRLYFDLIGIPPTPAQVNEFVAASKSDRQSAVVKLVDQLLDSPQYGERWGRHWLDVARYSDGYGGFLDSNVYSEAWRYRDWVVRAFNDDMPFDRFLMMQIAGDLLGDDPSGNNEDAVATGFFALGPTYRSDGGDPDSVAQAEAETLSDRLDTLGRGMLGLTLACARCHDHKFDPLPQQDYYSLAGVFKNTATKEFPLAESKVVAAYNNHQSAIADVNKRITELNNRIKKEKRKATDEETKQLGTWQQELDDLKKSGPAKYPFAHTLRDSGAADMAVAIRGNLRKPGEKAPRRFLKVLASTERPLFHEGSGRRQLAMAVSDPANPLTARVFVNRVWMHHFGEALVRTPDNFGALGEKPTHPELLDWLTAAFQESGGSLKQLHRLILTSATYQMSSDFQEQAFTADGDNRLLWRANPRRLDVEAWRDALLSVTNELDTERGGPPTDDTNSPRRALYFKVSRNGDVFATDEFLRRFDFPLMRATIDKRPSSIAPQQFLFLMNSTFMADRSRALVSRLQKEADTDEARVRLAYELLYQRPATAEELQLGITYLKSANESEQGFSAWARYAQVLLSANEFMFVR